MNSEKSKCRRNRYEFKYKGENQALSETRVVDNSVIYFEIRVNSERINRNFIKSSIEILCLFIYYYYYYIHSRQCYNYVITNSKFHCFFKKT